MNVCPCVFSEDSEKMQGSLGKVWGRSREGSEKVQGRFREGLRKGPESFESF